MQVVTVKTSTGQTRYYLANDDGTPVEPVLQYLKFRDNGGAARNTLRLVCIFLKHYFTYLEKRGMRWQAVTIDDLADFLAWLKYPRMDEKVIPLNLEPKYRAETINAILDTVLAFSIMSTCGADWTTMYPKSLSHSSRTRMGHTGVFWMELLSGREKKGIFSDSPPLSARFGRYRKKMLRRS